MQTINRSQLLQWINEVSFAVTDISLYLDTHPDDKEALAFFMKYNAERQKALRLYNNQFGPLLLDNITNTNFWNWATDPWPWEGEC